MKRIAFLAILIFSLAGAATAGYLTYRHYEILSGRMDKPSFCTINSVVDCDAVATSKYAEFAGIPVSTYGLAFYGVIAALAMTAVLVPINSRRLLLGKIVLLSALALAIDVGLAGILAFKLKVLCLLCVGTYLTNLAIFIIAFLNLPKTAERCRLMSLLQMPQWLKSEEKLGLVAGLSVVLSLALIAGAYGADQHWKKQMKPASSQMKPEDLKKQLKEWLEKQPMVPQDLVLTDGPFQGNPNAKVTIVVFSDFECPHCRRSAFLMHPVIAANRDKVRLYAKQYPLDQSCNSNIKHAMHKKACMFSRAALCAREQPPRDLFWDMHDILFEKGENLDEAAVLDQAAKLGMNRADFKKCLDSERTLKAVQADIALGDKLEVRSTPTVILDGHKLSQGVLGPDVLQVLIDLETERLK